MQLSELLVGVSVIPVGTRDFHIAYFKPYSIVLKDKWNVLYFKPYFCFFNLSRKVSNPNSQPHSLISKNSISTLHAWKLIKSYKNKIMC